MQDPGADRAIPELRALAIEASRALACLDAARLEELALSCQVLNRDLSRSQRMNLARQAREAAADMVVFGRVLEATRANLKVMNRLRELRLGRLEYAAPATAAGSCNVRSEGGDGDH